MSKKIVICGSIQFTDKFKEVADELVKKGFEVILPTTSEDLISGKVTREDLRKESESFENHQRKIEGDVISDYYKKIGSSDGILVVNIEKKNTPGYIGGNTFLEMGFAHVLNKPVYVYNELPEMSYTDELKAIRHIVINQDLSMVT